MDSVDEARLNNKKLAAALQTFRGAISTANLNRAHIVVSCRVSDWRGKADRESLQNELPYTPPNEQVADSDPDEVLLSPVFDRTVKEKRSRTAASEPDPSELIVVQLAPLTREQQQMAVKAAIPNVQEFVTAVRLSGLENLCERPGDLIGLIEYWLEHGKFGSLQEMTEEGIKRKLREEDERALKSQLAHDYLLASDRRHGVLLVSLHKSRTWRVASQTWDFARLISHLQDLASGIHSNESGPVQVSAFGLNATKS